MDNAFFTARQRIEQQLEQSRAYLKTTNDTDPVVREKVKTLEGVLKTMDEAAQPDYNKGWRNYEALRFLQGVLYAFAGPGMVGTSNAERPKGNYIDTRALASLSVKQRRGYYIRTKKALIDTAEAIGLDPAALPSLPPFHQIESEVE